MATGRGRREGALNERLRGARRANVDDNDTFELNIADLATAPVQSSSSPGSRSAQPGAHAGITSSTIRSAPRDETQQPPQLPVRDQNPGPRSSSVPTPAPPAPGHDESDVPEPLHPPSSGLSGTGSRERKRITEEITESPAGKPGSGRRQRIGDVPVSYPIPMGHRARTPEISDDEDTQTQPSPLANKKRPSDVSRPSIATVREESEVEEEEAPRDVRPVRQPQPRPEDEEEDEEHEGSDHSDDRAIEISDRKAAQQIGTKRPRPSIIRSIDTGSDESESDGEDEPAEKRQRRSPAVQKQPTKRPKPQQKKKKRHSSGSDRDDDAAIEITVQRFVNNFPRDGDDEDDLQQEIPFANRGGETVVDVFAQVCEEVISSALEQIQQLLMGTDDPEKKKEFRIKMRAIAAYREELNSRLLQHAIHLNHWHSLRRRLRHVQKEKLALRDEIIRLKGEREQVALRMDAIRVKHEADSKESTSRLNASSLMHDIDLAVEQGREAPELPPNAEREADLGNLDLILAQLSDQVSSTSSTGGLLQQVQDFNAFLERAVAALESG